MQQQKNFQCRKSKCIQRHAFGWKLFSKQKFCWSANCFQLLFSHGIAVNSSNDRRVNYKCTGKLALKQISKFCQTDKRSLPQANEEKLRNNFPVHYNINCRSDWIHSFLLHSFSSIIRKRKIALRLTKSIQRSRWNWVKAKKNEKNFLAIWAHEHVQCRFYTKYGNNLISSCNSFASIATVHGFPFRFGYVLNTSHTILHCAIFIVHITH